MADYFDKDFDAGEGFELTMERCRSCEHYEGMHWDGPPYKIRVFCQGVKRYAPTPRITWEIKDLTMARINSLEKLEINCGDYKRKRPTQTRLKV